MHAPHAASVTDAPVPAVAPAPESAADRPAVTATARTAPVRWLALRREIPRGAALALTVASFVVVALLYAWVTSAALLNPVFAPSPARIWDAARGFLTDGDLMGDVRVSVVRVTLGFLLSAALALPIGVLIGSFAAAESAVQPLTEFVRYIPVPALVPLMMVLFGLGELPKVMLIFVGTFFQLVLMVADEVRRVPYDLVQVSYTLGATRREIVRRVLWPAALPGIFDALRLCNGWAWTYLVVAELVAANEGLGYRILKFSRFLQTPKIFVYLLLLGIIGLTLDLVFRAFNRRAFRWAQTAR